MLEEKKGFLLTFVFLFFTANCIVMALDEHLPNGDKTILALQLVSHSCANFTFMTRGSVSIGLLGSMVPETVTTPLKIAIK